MKPSPLYLCVIPYIEAHPDGVTTAQMWEHARAELGQELPDKQKLWSLLNRLCTQGKLTATGSKGEMVYRVAAADRIEALRSNAPGATTESPSADMQSDAAAVVEQASAPRSLEDIVLEYLSDTPVHVDDDGYRTLRVIATEIDEPGVEVAKALRALIEREAVTKEWLKTRNDFGYRISARLGDGSMADVLTAKRDVLAARCNEATEKVRAEAQAQWIANVLFTERQNQAAVATDIGAVADAIEVALTRCEDILGEACDHQVPYRAIKAFALAMASMRRAANEITSDLLAFERAQVSRLSKSQAGQSQPTGAHP